MSVEPQALERSVLERKERDELAAIAEAMGVKTGSRTSKANLIGQILREAGIETGEEKPKRASRGKGDNGAKVDTAAEGENDAPAETATSRGDQSTEDDDVIDAADAEETAAASTAESTDDDAESDESADPQTRDDTDERA